MAWAASANKPYTITMNLKKIPKLVANNNIPQKVWNDMHRQLSFHWYYWSVFFRKATKSSFQQTNIPRIISRDAQRSSVTVLYQILWHLATDVVQALSYGCRGWQLTRMAVNRVTGEGQQIVLSCCVALLEKRSSSFCLCLSLSLFLSPHLPLLPFTGPTDRGIIKHQGGIDCWPLVLKHF